MARLIPASCGLVALLVAVTADPREATSQTGCPWDNRDFLGPCGPSLALPPWGNGAWNQPGQYTTIQTGDVDGDGAAELLGRSAFGVEVHKFSKERGEWLPFLATMPDANDRPVQDQHVLTRFADARGWRQPQYYATIQTGDIDGDGRAELVGRASIGMIVFKYSPGENGAPGAWRQLTGLTGGQQCTDNVGDVCATPFPDASGLDQPQFYTTLQLADVDGKPGAELHIRAGNGIWSYQWAGSGWQLLARVRDNFLDSGGWDQAQFYTTIQFADIDARPGAELIARGAGGITVWHFDGRNWGEIAAGGPFSGGGFAAPQYYVTIQTADVTGDGVAELLGRTANGIEVYRWEIDSWIPIAPIDGFFTDAQGWGQPQFYSTIQLADIDGDHAAELIGRANGALNVFKWSGAGWHEITSARTLGLVDSYAAEAFGASVTVPLWSEPHYYATIQSADVDGDGAAELLARGSFGIRTWRLDTSELRWSRYLAYGYPNPAFATPGQLSGYRALNALLGVADVRQAYGGSDSSLLSTYQTRIEGTCADRTTTVPPQYRSCTPPSGSGVGATDWTVVANAIVAELFHAQQVARYYDQLKSAQANLFADSREDLAAVAGQLKLDAQATEQDATVDLLSLLSDITDVLATFAEAADQEEVAVPLFVFSSVMGGIAGALPASSGLSFKQTYAQAIEHILADEQQREDVVEAQLGLVRGDLRLLTTVGELVSRPSPTLPLWQVDRNAYTSAARQGFATWVYQTFLPAIWDRWVVTGCVAPTSLLQCALPRDGTYMAAYDAAAGSFTGLLPKQTPCTTRCSRLNCATSCSWSGPSEDIVEILWGEITSECRFNRGAGHAWEYGCNLGLPAGPASDIFNNRNGWDFTTRSGSPDPGLAAVRGRVPIAPGRGKMRLSARVPLAQELDLAAVSVSVDRLLHEEGGAGELGHSLAGDAGAPPVHASRNSPTRSVFRSFPGDEPRVVVKLRIRRGQLEADLDVDRVTAHDPALCAGLAPSTDLWTLLTIDDGFNPPLPVQAIQAWECREKPDGGHVLLAPFGG